MRLLLRRMLAVLLGTAIMLPCGNIAAAAVLQGDRGSTKALAHGAVIDMSAAGSLSIYKYDMTTAEADGVYSPGSYETTGEANSGFDEVLADYVVEGVEFTYLRVGAIETCVRNGGESIDVVYEIPDELREILYLEAADAVDMTNASVSEPCVRTDVYHYTSQQINDALKDLLSNDNVGVKNVLESYVVENSDAVAMPLTDTSGYTSASGLELGLYLLVETKVPEQVTSSVNPWLVSLPFTDSEGETWLYDMTCYPKNQTGNPTLEKLVRDAHEEEQEYSSAITASEGDVLDYIFVSKLPHITSTATYLTEYTFVDTLSAGLSYNEDVKIAFYDNVADANINHTVNAVDIWSDDQYSCRYERIIDENYDYTGETSLTVAMTEQGLDIINEMYADYYMVVYYSVTIHSDETAIMGDDGNPNTVELIWRRTSREYYDKLKDQCQVYIFGLHLTKTFSDPGGDASAVQFILYNESDDYYIVGEEERENPGIYYVTDRVTSETDATIFSPSDEGILLVNGIEADTYQLTEIATDNGYSLLNAPVVIKISWVLKEDESTGGWSVDTTAAVDGIEASMSESGCSADARVDLSVLNNKTFQLPQTGGMGLYIVTITGVLLAAIGFFMILKRKKTN